MKLASRPLKPRKLSAARAETGALHPAAALRRTLTVTIIPVTFASGAAAPGLRAGVYRSGVKSVLYISPPF